MVTRLGGLRTSWLCMCRAESRPICLPRQARISIIIWCAALGLRKAISASRRRLKRKAGNGILTGADSAGAVTFMYVVASARYSSLRACHTRSRGNGERKRGASEQAADGFVSARAARALDWLGREVHRLLCKGRDA